jgi:hypothetical protein
VGDGRGRLGCGGVDWIIIGLILLLLLLLLKMLILLILLSSDVGSIRVGSGRSRSRISRGIGIDIGIGIGRVHILSVCFHDLVGRHSLPRKGQRAPWQVRPWWVVTCARGVRCGRKVLRLVSVGSKVREVVGEEAKRKRCGHDGATKDTIRRCGER